MLKNKKTIFMYSTMNIMIINQKTKKRNSLMKKKVMRIMITNKNNKLRNKINKKQKILIKTNKKTIFTYIMINIMTDSKKTYNKYNNLMQIKVMKILITNKFNKLMKIIQIKQKILMKTQNKVMKDKKTIFMYIMMNITTISKKTNKFNSLIKMKFMKIRKANKNNKFRDKIKKKQKILTKTQSQMLKNKIIFTYTMTNKTTI